MRHSWLVAPLVLALGILRAFNRLKPQALPFGCTSFIQAVGILRASLPFGCTSFILAVGILRASLPFGCTSFILAVAFAAPASAGEARRKCVLCPRPIPQYGSWGTYTIEGTRYFVHTDDPEPSPCRYCGGLMSPYSPWGKATRYADGRVVCQRCYATAIQDVKSAQAVLDDVRATMTGWGMRYAWGRIPVKLVGQRELVRIIAKDHPGMKPDGVCQPELSKRFMSDKWTVTDLNIFMLTGLPRTVFEKTAAHELTHAWMALAGCPRDQSSAFREGACNLAAYFYLQTRDTPAASKLKHFMLEDDDPVYGEGLRRHIRYATDHRVRGMLAILKTNRDFPAGY